MRGGNDSPLLFKAISVVTFVVLLLPVVIVTLAGLNSGEFLTFPPEGLSLRWVWAFLTSETFLTAYLFSFGLAFAAMTISTVIGTMAALFLVRFAGRWKNLFRGFFLSPLMLPGVVIGLSLYVFYISSGIGFARTFWGILVGHVIVTCPYVIGTVSAALVTFDRSYEEAARSLGAGPWTAFRKVTLPIVAPGVVAGAVFAFIVSFGQFEVALFLSTPNLEPLPIAMYISLRYAFEPTAAAAGIFAILLVVASMTVTARLVNLNKFSGIKFS